MHCPHCAIDINDPAPECPDCGFHIRDLDGDFGEPPQREGPLHDAAGLLSEPESSALRSQLTAAHAATGCELVVVTVADSGSRLPAEHVFWLFNRWSVGGERHAGILVLLSVAERRVEVEVGHALESTISDAESSALLQHHAVPFFAAGRFAEGLVQAVSLLETVLRNAEVDLRPAEEVAA